MLFLFCADFLIVTNIFLLALLVKHCHSLDFKQDQLRFIVVITGLSLFALICYHSNPIRSQSTKMRLLFRRSRYCNCIHHLHLHNIWLCMHHLCLHADTYSCLCPNTFSSIVRFLSMLSNGIAKGISLHFNVNNNNTNKLRSTLVFEIRPISVFEQRRSMNGSQP